MKSKIFGLLIFFIISSCASTSGQPDRQVYYSLNKEFKVTPPDLLEGARNVSDIEKPGVSIVNFSFNKTYWDAFGIYTVAWYSNTKNITADNFINRSIANVESIISNNYEDRGHFQLTETNETTVNGRQSLHFKATGELDGIEASWQGNVINFKNRVAIVSMVTPSAVNWPKSPEVYYENFVDSLERIEK